MTEMPDAAARAFATDPRHNVVLEASAGTGKTTVLVGRYVNLLRAGVDPRHILAITFTRKAAAEMRARIVDELRRAAERGSPADRRRWLGLRDRLGDIGISTIDAFCFSLLREFPLEADLDPGFAPADETEVARLVEEALDHALRVCQRRARTDEDVALVFARLSLNRLRAGLSRLLDRRVVADQALARYLGGGPRDLTAAGAAADLAADLQHIFGRATGGAMDVGAGAPPAAPVVLLDEWLADGPVAQPRFVLLADGLGRLVAGDPLEPREVRALAEDLRGYFVTRDGRMRQRPPYPARDHRTTSGWQRHRAAHARLAAPVVGALDRLDRALNVVLARGIRRIFGVALAQYRRTLESHGALDFAEVLARAVALLGRMDEFSQSRYRLESRYHHVLVDEFQDTSRLQWELVSLLVQSWGEGLGLAHEAPLQPSLFVVGDRKQSIYRFRDAEVGLLDEAARRIARLRPDGADVRRAISHSFRSHPDLLAFTNDLFGAMDEGRRDADSFRYRAEDHFPLDVHAAPDPRLPFDDPPGHTAAAAGLEADARLGLVVADTPEACAAAVADEVARVLGRVEVRDRETGGSRPARAEDVAILFRSRESHREIEAALEERGLPAYVYKGLGFYDSDEIKDLMALIRYLAAPESSLRAAAFLRSRFVRLSDPGLRALAPGIAAALTGPEPPGALTDLAEADRRLLLQARLSVPRWLALVDRVPQRELLDLILADSAYAFEWLGRSRQQARENVKKLRGLIRRVENRGYATLGRIADHLDRLSLGDESNASVDAGNAVNLMTIHAAKGLEFPIVFVVNLARGTGGLPEPVRVVRDGSDVPATVAVGPADPAVEEVEQRRDREETKRLLYVAITRARDRLYLASVLREGELKPGRGSLAEVLPADLRQVIAGATPHTREGGDMTWTGARHRHRLCVCPGARVVPEQTAADRAPSVADHLPAGLAPLSRDIGIARVSVIDVSRGQRGPTSEGTAAAAGGFGEAHGADVLVGRLVHRLLPFAASPAEDSSSLIRRAHALVDAEAARAVPDVSSLVGRAAALAARIGRRADVVAALSAGRVEYEVAFSTRGDAGARPNLSAGAANPNRWIVRGTIDCLVVAPDQVSVIEFKTGRPRPEDRRQLELYVHAARALYPGRDVRGVLVYP